MEAARSPCIVGRFPCEYQRCSIVTLAGLGLRQELCPLDWALWCFSTMEQRQGHWASTAKPIWALGTATQPQDKQAWSIARSEHIAVL